MAQAQVLASVHLSLGGFSAAKSVRSRVLPRLPCPSITRPATSFIRGSPLFWRTSGQRKPACKATSVSIRSEQSTKDSGSGLDIWLGRLAMVGFAVAITVEIVTGKGLLENFGLTSPLPTVALAVTALVGVLTAVFIFQSASKD